MYSNASGSVLVVSGVRKGMTAGILRGDKYTPIPVGPAHSHGHLVAGPGYSGQRDGRIH
jgi:hypothetical protein